MGCLEAARKTVRRLSDRIAPGDAIEHTMQFDRQPDASGFLDHYDTWQRMQHGQIDEPSHRWHLRNMQDHCVRHSIITAEEIAAINTKYGVPL